jgi:diphthamide synthase (EF-2-diphthine--ammonia ligase)
MWRALQITWRIVWRAIELAIVIYVLGAITDRSTSLIVGVLGLIYVTIRSAMLGIAWAFVHMETVLDRQVYELERLLRYQIERHEPIDLVQFGEIRSAPDTETVTKRFYVDSFIAWAFLALLFLICLLYVFSKLM